MKQGFRQLVALVAAPFVPLAVGAASAEPTAAERSWTFSAYFENDLCANTDGLYTNGVKLSWMAPNLIRCRDSGAPPDWSGSRR